jgi:LL-diaminopimelate aminotransferase
MDKLVGVLQNAGFQVNKSGGSFFLYMNAAKAAVKADGERVEFENGEALSQWLIREKLISTVPWDDAESAIRFSVTFAAKDETDEDRVIGEIASRLGDVKFEF